MLIKFSFNYIKLNSQFSTPSSSLILLMSLRAESLAILIFCFSRRLSSNIILKLCCFSAKSIVSPSFYSIRFFSKSPHSLPHLHFYFNCIFSLSNILIFCFIFCLWSSNISIPSTISSYLLLVSITLCCLALILQISKPCFIPLWTLLAMFESAISTVILVDFVY